MDCVANAERKAGKTLCAKISKEAAMPAQSSKGSKRRTFIETTEGTIKLACKKVPTKYAHKLGKDNARNIDTMPAVANMDKVNLAMKRTRRTPICSWSAVQAPRPQNTPNPSIIIDDISTDWLNSTSTK